MRLAALGMAAAAALSGPCAPTLHTSTGIDDGLVARVPKHYIVGASVTRLSAADLRRHVPGIVVSAYDGRSMIHRGYYGAPTIMDQIRAWLPTLKDSDWLIVEAAHGAVEPEVNRRYMVEVTRLVPNDVCLAWVIPSTRYLPPGVGPPTDWDYEWWNAATAEVIREEIKRQPCHAVVDWGTKVAQVPSLVYDGRHPRSPAGTWWYAHLVHMAVI